MLEQPAMKVLKVIASTLVGTGHYGTQAEAIRAIALDQVNRKISTYDRRVKQFERKHHTSFEAFGKHLQNRATVRQEDEWMEWEAAIAMREAWRKAKRTLEN